MTDEPAPLVAEGEPGDDKALIVAAVDDNGKATRVRWVTMAELESMRPEPDRAAVEEYDTLTRSAQESPPPCVGDSRFVDDGLPASVRKAAAAVCKTCPIQPECFAYASKAHPPAGIWGGFSFT